MAREFKLNKGVKFEFKRQAPTSTYPWADWFSGKLMLIERHSGTENAKGTIEEEGITTRRDYGVPALAMPPKIKTAARKRYKVVQTSFRGPDGKKLENGGILLQSRDMTPAERMEEDRLRAEEKAAQKATIEAIKAATKEKGGELTADERKAVVESLKEPTPEKTRTLNEMLRAAKKQADAARANGAANAATTVPSTPPVPATAQS